YTECGGIRSEGKGHGWRGQLELPGGFHAATRVGRNAEVLQHGQRRSFVQGRGRCEPRTPAVDSFDRRGGSLHFRLHEVVAVREQGAHALQEDRYPVQYRKSCVRPLHRLRVAAAAGQRGDERDRFARRLLRGLHVAKIGRIEGSARTTIVHYRTDRGVLVLHHDG